MVGNNHIPHALNAPRYLRRRPAFICGDLTLSSASRKAVRHYFEVCDGYFGLTHHWGLPEPNLNPNSFAQRVLISEFCTEIH